VNQTASGVLVSRSQHSESARQDFDKLVTMVSSGEVEGRIIDDPPPGMSSRDAQVVRRGVARGALAGFMLGLIPLLGSTLIAAAAGGMIAKATLIRIDRGTAPRLRFARDDE
jgi:hypothetical protein